MKASEIQMDETLPHGTREGYVAGCQGSHCPGSDRVGMTCKAANMRYAGDLSYRRRIDAGMSPEAIAADDALERESVPVAVNGAVAEAGSDRFGNSYAAPTVDVASSVEPIEEFDTSVLEELETSEPEAPESTEAAVSSAEEPVDAFTVAALAQAERSGIEYEKHGLTKGYYAGCRDKESCPGIERVGKSCTAAVSEYQRDLKARKAAEAALIAPKGHASEEEIEAAVERRVDAAMGESVEAVAVEPVLSRADTFAAALRGVTPALPEPMAPATSQGVRAEGLLSDLADAKDMIAGLEEENDRLARELAQTISDHVEEQTRVRGLQKQHDDDVARITKLQDELTQVSLRLDVQKSEHDDLVRLADLADAMPSPLTVLPAASTPELALEVSQPGDGVTAIRFAADGASRRLDLSFRKGRLQHAAITTGE